MKTITFDYTKKDGSTSERTLLAITEPHPATDKYAGIDISELTPEDGAEFVTRYENLYEKYLSETKELQAEFDVKHNYRQFFADSMSNVIEI
jgi:hypothetical protein